MIVSNNFHVIETLLGLFRDQTAKVTLPELLSLLAFLAAMCIAGAMGLIYISTEVFAKSRVFRNISIGIVTATFIVNVLIRLFTFFSSGDAEFLNTDSWARSGSQPFSIYWIMAAFDLLLLLSLACFLLLFVIYFPLLFNKRDSKTGNSLRTLFSRVFKSDLTYLVIDILIFIIALLRVILALVGDLDYNPIYLNPESNWQYPTTLSIDFLVNTLVALFSSLLIFALNRYSRHSSKKVRILKVVRISVLTIVVLTTVTDLEVILLISPANLRFLLGVGSAVCLSVLLPAYLLVWARYEHKRIKNEEKQKQLQASQPKSYSERMKELIERYSSASASADSILQEMRELDKTVLENEAKLAALREEIAKKSEENKVLVAVHEQLKDVPPEVVNYFLEREAEQEAARDLKDTEQEKRSNALQLRLFGLGVVVGIIIPVVLHLLKLT